MKKLLSLGGLAIVLVLFLVVNILFNALFTSTRFDLTESKLYTLSSGAKSLVSKLNDPVKLKYYFSRKLLAESDAAPLIGYGDRVRELLEEFVASSNGKPVDPVRLQTEDRGTCASNAASQYFVPEYFVPCYPHVVRGRAPTE